MDVLSFTITFAALGSLVGLLVYLIFYYMFQKLIASRTPEERSDISYLPAMGGFVYEELPAQSITQLLRDIFRRALGPSKLRGLVKLYVTVDLWYAIALLALLLLIIVSILGW